jgi:hypothetical protein
MDPEVASTDYRKLRHTAPFTRTLSNRTRYIHEEQLSFILVGHGSDVWTNYQLAEKYFVAPQPSSAGGLSVFVSRKTWNTPCAMFLAWIYVAFHHVTSRWQLAIDAVDAQIDSPFQVIFQEDKPDLLSDDPHFSRSKTYFWAVQVFKLFEEYLTKTIRTWEEFKANSLDKISDNRTQEAKKIRDEQVHNIDVAVAGLRNKLQRVVKKREEVISLREGVSPHYDT